jgi:hypothetical protein
MSSKADPTLVLSVDTALLTRSTVRDPAAAGNGG